MKPTKDKGCPSNFIMSKKGSKEQKFSKCSIQDIQKEIDSTANVFTINFMEFDHVPNPGIIPPEFLGYLTNRLNKK